MPAKKIPVPAGTAAPTEGLQLGGATNHPSSLEWFANENNQQFVKSLLQNPQYQTYCHHVAALAEVSEDMLTGNPVPEAVIVRQSAFAAGLRAHPRYGLKLLAAATKVSKPEMVAYEHIETPEHLKRALQQST